MITKNVENYGINTSQWDYRHSANISNSDVTVAPKKSKFLAYNKTVFE